MATAPACERASDWTCPICLEMLCKPTVLPCGHTLCYWDAHRSMSAFDVSACPVCRTPFAHFPQICESLHAHLGLHVLHAHAVLAKPAVTLQRLGDLART